MSNRIAHALIAKGVKPNDIVAFALPRNSYLIPVMFGILKSGAAYMPIDPDYPQDRIEFMLKDSNAKFFITENNLNDYISNDETLKNIAYVSLNNKYCIIYTSGSTGMPKGCVLQHKGVANFCINNNVVNWAERKKIDLIGTSINNVTFDYFIAENIVLLIRGYKTVLCNENESINSSLFEWACKANNVNIVQTTPTKYKILFQDNKLIEQLRIAVTSGEPLTLELLNLLLLFTKNK